MEAFKNDITNAELAIIETGGVFFKPVSNGQIEANWNKPMIDGFFELGKEFPENAAELFAICSI